MELRSSGQQMTAASADRLYRREERLEAVIAIADPSTMQPNWGIEGVMSELIGENCSE